MRAGRKSECYIHKCVASIYSMSRPNEARDLCYRIPGVIYLNRLKDWSSHTPGVKFTQHDPPTFRVPTP